MAFVKAKRGTSEIMVSQQAYDKIFRKRGYRLLNGAEKVNTKQEEQKEETGEPEELEDIDTIPVSDMDKEQLKRFAEKHGIDTTGAKNVSEARRKVQRAMKERQMQ